MQSVSVVGRLHGDTTGGGFSPLRGGGHFSFSSRALLVSVVVPFFSLLVIAPVGSGQWAVI